MLYRGFELFELFTIPPYVYDKVLEWNKVDDRITILTLEALSNHVLRSTSTPVSGVAAAFHWGWEFLGASWTLKLRDEWRSATIIERSIRGKGYGSVLFRYKVALFKNRIGIEFPEVTLDPNNEPSYNMVQSSGIKMRFNPNREEI